MADDNKESTDFWNPFDTFYFPIEDWTDELKPKIFAAREFVRPLREPFDWMINHVEAFLSGMPQIVLLAILGLLGWQSAGWRVGFVVVGLMAGMGMMGDGAWDLGMVTLSIVVSAVILCFLFGFPIGVLAGKNDRFESTMRPVLDTMQTIPAFVYLAPVVIMIGIGKVAGVLVTVVFALPPLIRLTSLGIRQVNPHVVEAMLAFGATPGQIMWKAQIPLAVPTIMAGLNQTILLSLSMVVIASMISVPGFGNEVLRAMGRLDIGKALVGGTGIVILAIVLDRITQGLGRTARQRGSRHWYERGPAGLLCALWRMGKKKAAERGSAG